MNNNTTFTFYTSTGRQDANRIDSPYARLCPRHSLLPFQIERNHNTSPVSAVNLVDCDGGKTSLGTNYFSSIGTSIATSSVGVIQFTDVDYIQYNGQGLLSLLPYGVYYVEVIDGHGEYYSEHISVRDLQPIQTTEWAADDYTVFTTSGMNITSAIGTANVDYIATTDVISGGVKIGDNFNFIGNFTQNSGGEPNVYLVDGSGNIISNIYNLDYDGMHDIELTATKTEATAKLAISIDEESNYSVTSVSLRKMWGDFVKVEFSNSSDLLHSKEDNIMYSTGGFKQRVYFDTIFNDPKRELIDIGNELNGEFIPEKINSTYIYNVIDYVSRSMFKGMSYLPLHDNITITDEVGSEYSPDTDNISVEKDSNTFDMFTMRIEFNDGSMTWVNDQTAIT